MTKFNAMCCTSSPVSASADTMSCCASSENMINTSVVDAVSVSTIIIISIIGLLGLIRLWGLVPYPILL